jgi:hypothetical protein
MVLQHQNPGLPHPETCPEPHSGDILLAAQRRYVANRAAVACP